MADGALDPLRRSCFDLYVVRLWKRIFSMVPTGDIYQHYTTLSASSLWISLLVATVY